MLLDVNESVKQNLLIKKNFLFRYILALKNEIIIKFVINLRILWFNLFYNLELFNKSLVFYNFLLFYF